MTLARKKGFADLILTDSASRHSRALCLCHCHRRETRMIVPLLIRLRATIVGPGAWMTSFEHCVTTVVLAVSASSVVKNGLRIIVALSKFNSMSSKSFGIFATLKIREIVSPIQLNPLKLRFWLRSLWQL